MTIRPTAVRGQFSDSKGVDDQGELQKIARAETEPLRRQRTDRQTDTVALVCSIDIPEKADEPCLRMMWVTSRGNAVIQHTDNSTHGR